MKHKLKRLLCGVLVMCQVFTMTAFAKPEWPKDTGIMAEAGAVMDMDSGTMIFGQNSHVAYPPASITKLLTALVVLENVDDLSATVEFTESAMMNVEPDSGNKMSLVIGDTMTVEDALYALLLQSVNQSANALAEHVAGSMDAFVEMMNAKLVELGCQDSHFDNPSGLNGDTQNVSAYDMALIGCAAFNNEKLLEISSTESHRTGAIENHPNGYLLKQEHRLVITEDPDSEFYYPEAVAGKTGYLIKAGNTLVTYAEKDGRRLVSVILKGSPRQYFVDGKELLRFGFDSFYNANIAENETAYVTGETAVEIGGSSYAPSDLEIEEGRMITLPEGAVFSDAELTLVELPEEHPEDAVGLLRYIYNERKIGEAYLLLKESDVAVDTTVEDTVVDPTEPDATEGYDPEATGAEDTEVKEDSKDGGFSILPILVILLLGAAGGGGYYWIQNERKKEAEAAARRREKRRQRLMEEGAEAEAEFNRLLEAKRNRKK
ncbi:MAG: D-alanyl-D-alanine carboxypeptidase [Lachnospiraceae bacterium]|nr:D-alanyl-D-alanine carboxypeptidase [Lachnospiraceae bacterium]